MNREYFIQEFYQHAGYPKYNKYNKTYSAGCPVCREGSSWGIKRRLYYLIDTDQLYCHNCGWSGGMIKWLMQVANKTYEEINNESRVIDISNRKLDTDDIKYEVESLPADSINIFDKMQLNYWKNDKVVLDCIALIINRRLHVAVNRPSNIYLSLNDRVHKNRLCIPFYGADGDVLHYQTRALYESDKPNYLSKVNSDKTLFGYDKVTPSIGCVYITEGPLDAFFICNGLAVAGIQPKSNQLFTPRQKQQIDKLILVDRVWLLDSQHTDHTSHTKTIDLISKGEKVFIWPDDIGKQFKDVNEYCVSNKVNEFPNELITQNVFSGSVAKMKMQLISYQ